MEVDEKVPDERVLSGKGVAAQAQAQEALPFFQVSSLRFSFPELRAKDFLDFLVFLQLNRKILQIENWNFLQEHSGNID